MLFAVSMQVAFQRVWEHLGPWIVGIVFAGVILVLFFAFRKHTSLIPKMLEDTWHTVERVCQETDGSGKVISWYVRVHAPASKWTVYGTIECGEEKHQLQGAPSVGDKLLWRRTADGSISLVSWPRRA